MPLTAAKTAFACNMQKACRDITFSADTKSPTSAKVYGTYESMWRLVENVEQTAEFYLQSSYSKLLSH